MRDKRKVLFFADMADMVCTLLYCNEDLSIKEIKKLFESGKVTIEEATDWFQLQLCKGLGVECTNKS